ncbi:hypothetical protein ACUOFC_29925, partial [Escherichia sp. TWPC-MK]
PMTIQNSRAVNTSARVTIACDQAPIAVGGLGQMVLRGIGRLDMGLATVGGVGIVILAIILDRLTQAVGRDSRSRGNRRWYTTGPVGLLTRPFIK